MKNLLTIICALFLILFSTNLSATVWHVDANVLGGNNDGTSWANAFDNLQAAIDAANPGETIRVAEGTYYPTKDKNGSPNPSDNQRLTFYFSKDLKLYGGFSTGGCAMYQRDVKNNKTILSGDIGVLGVNSDNAYSVVNTKKVSADFLMDGFFIVEGNANDDGFADNDKNSGGGWFNNSGNGESSPTIINCHFQNNKAAKGGGALYNLITNGISAPTLVNCSFQNNRAFRGSGIHNRAENSAVCVPLVINCTFFDNHLTVDLSRSVIYNRGDELSSAAPIIKNCIFWNNDGKSDGNFYNNMPIKPKMSYSLIEENNCPPGIICETGMIYNQDPLFIDPDNGDLELQACSPTINAGTATDAPSKDWEGDARPQNGGFDMGIDEFTGMPANFVTCYIDSDGDTYGDINAIGEAHCEICKTGYVLDNTDCDDSNAALHPNATEICDGIDNNCNSQTDEGVTTTYYADTDGDGYGDANNSQLACSQPTNYVTDNTDCDDGDASIYPGAPELCDGIDNNCNSQTDEEVTTTYYADTDGDGYGDANNSQAACSQPTNYVTDNTDCDDGDASIYPGAPELCDGLDNDCDGSVDNIAGGAHIGNVVLLTQWDVDIFPNCFTKIEGNLVINGLGITNLLALAQLEEVTGDVVINGTSISDFTGLDNLEQIGGDLLLSNNNTIINCFGLESLNSIGEGLTISQNLSIQNLNGLEGLNSIQGDLSIFMNFTLNSLSGLDYLTTVTGNLTILNNFILSDCCPIEVLLNNGVGGMIFIMGNATSCENQAAIGLACLINWNLIGMGSNSSNIATNESFQAWESAVYPNPANFRIHVLLSEHNGEGEIELHDRMGLVVQSKSIQTHQTKEMLEIAHLPEGIYFLKIQIENRVEMHKIMIQSDKGVGY